tara:strand:+ start:27543 stop:27932 length:390 start_codon:yes stop_codon:yes gene_type:complete
MKNNLLFLLLLTLFQSCNNSIELEKPEKKAYLLPTNIDLGKISCQKTKKIELKVVNPSSKTITIEGVSKSCSCTDVEVSSYNVKPNSHSTISLVYNPIDDFQKVKKSIIIRTSDGQILSFKFEADVLAQ